MANKSIERIILAQGITFNSSEHVFNNNVWKFLPEIFNYIDNIT